MNGFYVFVSLQFLLILAGFNHAHGLTTFGKSQNTQQNAQFPHVQPKVCTVQTNCTLIKDTTCLKGYCLCGDNTHPVNGGCKTVLKGSRHICTKDEECVEGADCKPPKDKNKFSNPNDKICICQEGYYETRSGLCGGATTHTILPVVTLLITMLITNQFN